MALFVQEGRIGWIILLFVNGDGTYTARFYNGSTARYVTVDQQLPASGGNLIFDGMGASATNSANILWVALTEKAYVQDECGWIRLSSWGGGQNVYTGISEGDVYMALRQITGQATVAFEATSSSSSFTTFAGAFAGGKSVCLGSKSAPASSAVIGSHADAVLSVDAATQTVTMFNPWDINNSHDSGIITLS